MDNLFSCPQLVQVAPSSESNHPAMAKPDGYQELDLDTVNAWLAMTTKQVETASQLFDAAAKMVGLAQTYQSGDRSGLGKALIDSAYKTMELANAEIIRFQREAKEAEKNLMSVNHKLAGLDEVDLRPYYSSDSSLKTVFVNRKTKIDCEFEFLQRKRRYSPCSDVFEDEGHTNLKGDAGNQYSVRLKKSKIDNTKAVSATDKFKLGTASALPPVGFSIGSVPTASPDQRFLLSLKKWRKSRILGGIDNTTNVIATNTFEFDTPNAALPMGFLFGSIPAALPAQPFVFGSNSEDDTATRFASTPVAAVTTDYISPTGKENISDKNSTDDVAKALKPVLELRKIEKASSSWCKIKPGETTNKVKVASAFASVKLPPPTVTESEKEKPTKSSEADPTRGASATPVASVPTSFAGMPSDNASYNKGEEGAGDPKAKREGSNEKETL